jgi:hypothetical protein
VGLPPIEWVVKLQLSADFAQQNSSPHRGCKMICAIPTSSSQSRTGLVTTSAAAGRRPSYQYLCKHIVKEKIEKSESVRLGLHTGNTCLTNSFPAICKKQCCVPQCPFGLAGAAWVNLKFATSHSVIHSFPFYTHQFGVDRPL